MPVQRLLHTCFRNPASPAVAQQPPGICRHSAPLPGHCAPALQPLQPVGPVPVTGRLEKWKPRRSLAHGTSPSAPAVGERAQDSKEELGLHRTRMKKLCFTQSFLQSLATKQVQRQRRVKVCLECTCSLHKMRHLKGEATASKRPSSNPSCRI